MSTDDFEQLLAALRPRLHRYCARMVGSSIDGEDVVQEALVKAIEAVAAHGRPDRPEGWLFRIAHNAALDFLRRRRRLDELVGGEIELDGLVDPASLAADPDTAAAGLGTFMRLPVAERGAVLLMDLMGYSLVEIGAAIDASVPAVKAALHRGRRRLRNLAAESDTAPVPPLPPAERARLDHYVDRFNAREFDQLRDLLAEDVRLDLVARLERRGRAEVGRYFTNYAALAGLECAAGRADGRPAVLVRAAADPPGTFRHCVLIGWAGERIALIRDFIHAPYAMADAVLKAN